MKTIFKKNQLIITALAALIAVAGYLNYTEKNIDDKAKTASATESTQTTDSNGQTEDNVANVANATESDDLSSTEGSTESTDGEQADSGDIQSNDQDVESTPGEAIFVNATGTVDFIVEAKLSKEYNRVTIQEELQPIASNTELTEEERQSAIDRIVEITEISEREVAAENLIMAKGYSDVVVTMTDGYVDVIVAADEMDAVTRAQIEDIVKRKMGVEADKITINVISVNN